MSKLRRALWTALVFLTFPLFQVGDSDGLSKESSYKYPFQNPTLPWSVRVDDLVSRLTIDEVARQTTVEHGHHAATPAIDRLGIKPWVWISDCNRGFARTNGTAYPQSIGLAASFSREIQYAITNATSYEMRAWYNHNRVRGEYKEFHGLACFSPTINIMRHPFWGRNQETPGEDPYLTAELVTHFIRGLKGNHPRYMRVVSGCKHFDVHGGPENIPFSRKKFNAVITMRDWRTTWLPAFHACVKEETLNIMCSFNSINGTPACANKYLLNDILRDEWGYPGLVISDNNAISSIVDGHHYVDNYYQAMVSAIKAGTNLELGTPHYWNQALAVKNGDLTEAEVRQNVKPIFYTRMRLGEFDPPEMNPYLNITDMSLLNCARHRQIALEAAQMSFVLLKNRNNVLPITKFNNTLPLEKIAVVGPFGDDLNEIWGSYGPNINSQFATTPFKGLKSLGKQSVFAAGCTDGHRCTKYSADAVKRAVQGANLVVICLGLGGAEGESNDRNTMELPGHQHDLLFDAAVKNNATVILLLFNADAVNITWAVTSNAVEAIVECFYPAQSAGVALFNVLTGIVSPAGRLPYTWPANMDQVPSMTNYSMDGHTYRYWHGDPLFPFGYGLSYTRWRYNSFTISPDVITAGQNATLNVTVANVGNVDADEVVQVYLSWNQATVPVPKRTLVAFDKIHVKVGEVGRMTSTLTAQQMAVWDDAQGWQIQAGELTLCTGGQQPDQKTRVPSNVICKTLRVQTNQPEHTA